MFVEWHCYLSEPSGSRVLCVRAHRCMHFFAETRFAKASPSPVLL